MGLVCLFTKYISLFFSHPTFPWIYACVDKIFVGQIYCVNWAIIWLNHPGETSEKQWKQNVETHRYWQRCQLLGKIVGFHATSQEARGLSQIWWQHDPSGRQPLPLSPPPTTQGKDRENQQQEPLVTKAALWPAFTLLHSLNHREELKNNWVCVQSASAPRIWHLWILVWFGHVVLFVFVQEGTHV